jgi:uncharacterized membrane protein YeaQ/YmgE (transglycosylase-associated protein family)
LRKVADRRGTDERALAGRSGAIVAVMLPVLPLAAAGGKVVIAVAVIGAVVLLVIVLRSES